MKRINLGWVRGGVGGQFPRNLNLSYEGIGSIFAALLVFPEKRRRLFGGGVRAHFSNSGWYSSLMKAPYLGLLVLKPN